MTMFRRRHEIRQGQPPEVEGEIRQGHPFEVEGEIRELVRRGIPQARPESGSEVAMGNLNSLIQSISGLSLLEVEKLIDELKDLRDYLMNEGQRIQRAITEYADMSQAATKSTKIIAESLAQWKQTAEIDRRTRRG
jgi:hypothetical protein